MIEGELMLRERKVRFLLAIITLAVATTVLLPCLSGCMTVKKAERQSAEVWSNRVTRACQKLGVATNLLSFAEPGDRLRLRLAIDAEEAGLDDVARQLLTWQVVSAQPTVSNGLLRLSLADALRLAAKNDRTYQDHKQGIYNAALALDTRGHDFDTTFSGFLLGTLAGDPTAQRLSGQATAGVQRKLSTGSTLSANLALNVAQLLKGDVTASSLLGDVSVSIPLLRGSGRTVVLEPLIQAERNLHYAIRQFAYYRTSYAVQVASAYFNVLSCKQRIWNAESTERSNKTNKDRADRMFEANRMSIVDYGQAGQAYLNAVQTTLSARQAYDEAVDSFAVLLGLPPGIRIILDDDELQRMHQKMATRGAGTEESVLQAYPSPEAAFASALTNRYDLMNVRDRVDDARRALVVAADNLRPDLTIGGTASANRSKDSRHSSTLLRDNNWDATVKSSLPWDRVAERNAYRSAMLALESAERDYENTVDRIDQTLRSDIRDILTSYRSYLIQQRAVEVAEKRRESMYMLQQADRTEMRYVIDAENDLLAARNSLLDAIVNWHLKELALQRDMGVLSMSADGLIQ